MTQPRPSSMRRDVASAYLASGVKVLAWAWISRITFVDGDASQFAILALVRSTIGLLNYTTLGLAPAMIHMLAQAAGIREIDPADLAPIDENVVSYRNPRLGKRNNAEPAATVYANGLILCILLAVLSFLLLTFYSGNFDWFHKIPAHPRYWKIQTFVWALGFGLICRLFSDSAGAMLQVRGLIWLDNLLLAGAEVTWLALTYFEFENGAGYGGSSYTLMIVGNTFATSGAILLVSRVLFAAARKDFFRWRSAPLRASIMLSLLSFGALVAIGQLADFLYAPVDFILINRLITPDAVAIYSPAVQIDAGLLLLVGGLAAVMLPRAAIAHAAGNRDQLRRDYLRGTFATFFLLAVAAAAVYVASPFIFRVWLSDPMTATQLILPLVLIHTVVGGSSAVGRSILLGMGKVKPLTIAVLIAGATNVALSYIFVRYLHLGLAGIVYGTIVAVIGRSAIWMPWYILRTLRREK